MSTLGIDFGTSSTVAVLAFADGRAVPLLFGETPLLPSAVCVGPGGTLLVGRDAVQASRGRPEAFEPHPKSRIDDGEILLGERAWPVVELIAAVLRRVRDEAVRVAGAPVDAVTLSHPAAWGAPRRRALAEVGGSSRMSLAATLLHRALGVAPTVLEQPETIVAGGTLHAPAVTDAL